jgi:hypothetical protein
MNSNRFVWSLFFFLHFMIALQIVYYAPQLPPQMASHFNGAGQANAYQSKAGFIGFYIGLVLLMSGIFAGLGLLLPKIPVRLINIPNKDYWFVGECAHESFIFLTRQMIRLANANAFLSFKNRSVR